MRVLEDSDRQCVNESDTLYEGAVVLLDPVFPLHYSFEPPYPNPFNCTVSIRYQLPSEELLRIAVYDLSGREVAVLRNGKETVGYHSATWQADGQASGVYFCRLNAGGYANTIRLNLVR